MGRHRGYLALMGAIAGHAAYVLIPEWPPEPGWERELCEIIGSGRAASRRHSIVIVAEGRTTPPTGRSPASTCATCSPSSWVRTSG